MGTDELQDHYRHLDNARLAELALYEVRDLRPEAVDTLRSEIRQRDLPEELHEAMDLQRRELTDAELLDFTSWFRASACPLCGSRSSPLNACGVSGGGDVGSVAGARRQLIAGCPRCLDLQLTRVSRQAHTSGCLAFPWGLFRAARVAGDIDDARRNLETNEPTPGLGEFVVRYAGAIHVARVRGLNGLPGVPPEESIQG